MNMTKASLINSENIILEDAQVGNSPFDADEVFNKEMKAYPDETLGISDIHKYSHKLENLHLNIAELEKENAELKQFIKTQGRKLRQQSKECDKAINRVEILAKENAELKERIKTLTIHDTNAVLSALEMQVAKDSHRDRANKIQEQLTKAKEIIKNLIAIYYDPLVTESDVKVHNKIIAEAENFLKESEGK